MEGPRSEVSEKIKQLADAIAAQVAASIPGAMRLENFKCTVDYHCTGAQEFICSTFRCPGTFKVKDLESAS